MQPRQPGGGPKGQNKEPLSQQFTKRTELKAALTGSTRRVKRQPAKESTTIGKGKTLTLCSNLEVAEGEDVEVDEGVDG